MASISYQDWHPSTPHAACMPHTWITRWDDHSVKALVTQARAESWECLVIASGHHDPLTAEALAELRLIGAEIAIDPDEIHATLTAVVDLVRQRRQIQGSRPERLPLLLLVDDGQHLPNDMLDSIVRLGRAANVHVAIDERARARTSGEFQDNICGMYRL